MATSPTAPTGQQTLRRPMLPTTGTGGTLPTWGSIATRVIETAPDWIYPYRTAIVHEMRTTSQVAALESAFFLPIQELPWRLEANDLPLPLAQKFADDLNLPIAGQGDQDDATRRYQVGFRQLLRHALTAALFGHAVCEIVGDITMDPGYWRVARFVPIAPDQIDPDRWVMEPDGTLRSLSLTGFGPYPIDLDAAQVQRWTFQPQPGDPTGTSMLRPLYRHYLLHDELLRVAQAQQNVAATGRWVVTGREGARDGEIEDAVDAISGSVVDEEAAIGVEHGTDVENVAIAAGVDPLPLIRYHEEAMARAWNEQVIQLGTTAFGSRSVGETHEAIASAARAAFAEDVAEELNRQVLARMLEFNGITDLKVRPKITCSPPTPVVPIVVNTPPALPAAQPDVAASRHRHTATCGHIVAAARATPADTGKVPGVPQATRALRAAERSTSFADIHGDWEDAVGELTTTYRAIRGEQLRAALEVVSAAQDVQAILATLRDDTRAAALDAVPNSQVTAATTVLADVAQSSAQIVAADATSAGTTLTAVSVDYADVARTEVTLTTQQIASTVSDEVTNRTAQLATANADGAQVAQAVREQIDAQLTDAQLVQAAGGDTTRAQATGRALQTQAASEQIRDIYASSVLDGNTCGPCADLDGTQYASVDDAEQDFPTGGYSGCEGGDRCRCLYVVTWESEQALAVDDRGNA